MKHVCPVCNRSGIDQNLSCTEINCPIDKHGILGSGQIVGDIKVIQLRQITHTYAIYDGMRRDKKVFLKVAHQGAKRQLEQEAIFLAPSAQKRARMAKSRTRYLVNIRDPFPGMPTLLPAYSNTGVEQFPFGHAQVGGKHVTFAVWEPIDGIPLTQYLAGVPEPWFDNAAFVVIRIAYVLQQINQAKVCNGKLTPDAIWVSEDDNGVLRAVLTDFGLLRPNNALSSEDLTWLHKNSNLAYIAPEIISENENNVPNYNASSGYEHLIDVYGIGMILYEMLSGKPKYSHFLRTRSQIVNDVKRGQANPLIRKDIEKIKNRRELIDIAKLSTRHHPGERGPKTIAQFIGALEKVVGRIPEPKKQGSIGRTVTRTALIAGVIIGIFLILGVATSM